MKIIDLHCDTLTYLTDFPTKGDLESNPWTVDIKKLEAADYAMQTFAIFMDIQKTIYPFGRYKQMLQVFSQNVEENKERIEWIRNFSDLERAMEAGKIGALLSVEDGGIVSRSMDHLAEAYRDGVRLVTLTWNHPNGLAFPQGEKYEGRGLTPKGRQFVEVMETLGMIVDCSHVNDRGTEELLDFCKKPIIASHSNARAVTPHRRNLPNHLIRRISHKGGVIGLNFCQAFLGTSPISLVEDMVTHINHIYNVGGEDVLALGTDFDGIQPTIEIENASQMYKLIDALKGCGFSDRVLDKLLYKNVERVCKEILK